MTEPSSYYEQLRHPKWQKKRLEVMELAGFACEDCGSAEKTLNVHHAYYEKGLAPWEYSDETLHCLCEDCHKRAQDLDIALKRQIGRTELCDREQLLGYAMGLEALTYPMVVLDVFSYEVALGVSNAWHLSAEKIINALQDGTIDGYKLDQLRRGNREKSKESC